MNDKQKVELALTTLNLVMRVYKEALPNFNWGASALDANAIDLINRSALAAAGTIKELETTTYTNMTYDIQLDESIQIQILLMNSDGAIIEVNYRPTTDDSSTESTREAAPGEMSIKHLIYQSNNVTVYTSNSRSL